MVLGSRCCGDEILAMAPIQMSPSKCQPLLKIPLAQDTTGSPPLLSACWTHLGSCSIMHCVGQKTMKWYAVRLAMIAQRLDLGLHDSACFYKITPSPACFAALPAGAHCQNTASWAVSSAAWHVKCFIGIIAKLRPAYCPCDVHVPGP